MELSTDRIAAHLAGEPLRPAYLVAGAETLLVLEAADAVRMAARAQGIGDREVHDMEGRDADWGALAASLLAPSLFATRRLVEVRLPTGKPGTEGGKLIAEFCAAPPPDVVLLVIAGEWSRQHPGKWTEAIARVGHTCIAWQVRPHELESWIERRLRQRGLRATPDAVARLAQVAIRKDRKTNDLRPPVVAPDRQLLPRVRHAALGQEGRAEGDTGE